MALWRISRIEAAIAFGTFVLTIATAPSIYWGVLGGLLAALAHYMYRHPHPRIVEVGLHPDGSLRDRHLLEPARTRRRTCTRCAWMRSLTSPPPAPWSAPSPPPRPSGRA